MATWISAPDMDFDTATVDFGAEIVEERRFSAAFRRLVNAL